MIHYSRFGKPCVSRATVIENSNNPRNSRNSKLFSGRFSSAQSCVYSPAMLMLHLMEVGRIAGTRGYHQRLRHDDLWSWWQPRHYLGSFSPVSIDGVYQRPPKRHNKAAKVQTGREYGVECDILRRGCWAGCNDRSPRAVRRVRYIIQKHVLCLIIVQWFTDHLSCNKTFHS